MVLVYDITLRERIASISFEEERCVEEEYWEGGGVCDESMEVFNGKWGQTNAV